MTPVFLDTVGLVAVWDRTDQWHQAAAETYLRLLQQRRPLLTTSLIFLECGNATARRPYRSRVNVLRQVFIKTKQLIEPTTEDIESAWTAFECGDAAQAGIVDHVSFAVMRRLGVAEAFTNDRHFTAAGFTTLF